MIFVLSVIFSFLAFSCLTNEKESNFSESFISSSEEGTFSDAARTENQSNLTIEPKQSYQSNDPTIVSRKDINKRGARQLVPEIPREMVECVRKDPMSTNKYRSVFHTFRVGDVKLCWEYCAYVWECQVFSFHFKTRQCVLFSVYNDDTNGSDDDTNDDTDVSNDYNDDNYQVRFSIACLECPQNVSSIIDHGNLQNTNANGFLIADRKFWPRCFSVFESSGRYFVKWENCSKATLWTLSESQLMFEGERNVIRILMHSSPHFPVDGSLHVKNLKVKPLETFTFPPLNQISDITFIISKNNKSQCSFTIKNLQINYMKLEWRLWMDISSVAYPTSVKFMSDLRIWRPRDGKPICYITDITVKHGKVENPGKVPFLLEGSWVRIRCDPGYGVAALNFTPFQAVTCSEHIRILPCRSLTLRNVTSGTDYFTSLTNDVTSGADCLTSLTNDVTICADGDTDFTASSLEVTSFGDFLEPSTYMTVWVSLFCF